jgi:hypothetical protein
LGIQCCSRINRYFRSKTINIRQKSYKSDQ